jgi:hypothetical protein
LREVKNEKTDSWDFGVLVEISPLSSYLIPDYW